MHPVSTCQDPATQHSPLSSFPTPNARFDIVHIDLVGPLLPCQGFTYLLTCVDCYTRWPEAIPLTSSTAEVVAQALLSGWISCFGVPSTIITDHGRQFESNLWKNLMALIGSKRAQISPYHPQSNGTVERFHLQLKTAFEAQPNLDAWMDTLPFILLSIRTASGGPQHNRSGNGIWHHTPSPTTSLLDPSEFLNRLRTHFRTISPVSLQPTQRTTNIADGLAKATHVFVRYDVVCKPLQPANILWQYELTNTLRSQLMAATLPSQSIASSPFIWTSNQIRNTHLLLQNRYQMNNLITYPSLPTSLLILIHHFHPRTLPPSHSSIHTPTIPRSTRSGHRVHFPQYFSHHV